MVLLRISGGIDIDPCCVGHPRTCCGHGSLHKIQDKEKGSQQERQLWLKD